MKACDCPPVTNGQSPRLQIFRGLPGCGMESAASQYPCLHLNEFLDRYTAGRCDVSSARTPAIERNFIVLVKSILKKGIDLVVSGVFGRPESTFGWLVYYAMCFGYEVWVKDFLNEKEPTVRCSWQELERFRNEFVAYEPELFGGRFNRFSNIREDLHPSKDDCVALAAFAAAHVHKGAMPMDYPVI